MGNNPVCYRDPDGRETYELTNKQRIVVQSALYETKSNLKDLKNQLQDYLKNKSSGSELDEKIKTNAEKYLGLDLGNIKNLETLISDLDKISSYLNKLEPGDFRFDTNGDNKDGTIKIAYIYSVFWNKKIYLTKYFFSCSDNGNQSKSGTIFHEASHKAIGTNDYAYPYQSEFETLTNKKKVKNAASWQFFYEGIYKNGR